MGWCGVIVRVSGVNIWNPETTLWSKWFDLFYFEKGEDWGWINIQCKIENGLKILWKKERANKLWGVSLILVHSQLQKSSLIHGNMMCGNAKCLWTEEVQRNIHRKELKTRIYYSVNKSKDYYLSLTVFKSVLNCLIQPSVEQDCIQ